jgi:predicted phage replisome organizer
MAESHKYYWLKLKRDFFKRHDIIIIEAMPNGKDYILFYLKLLCESVDHEGNLRFSETIPYSDDMLATITRTNVDIVRSAVKIFSELGMMEQLDDGTLFMAQVAGMIGSETSDAIRMRIARDGRRQLLIGDKKPEQCSEPFKKRSPELELDIEKELEKEKEGKKAAKPPVRTFIKPTIEEVTAYCKERGGRVDPQSWLDHYESNGWKVGKNPMRDWRAAVRTWERTDYGPRATTQPQLGQSPEEVARREARIREVVASGRFTEAEARANPWHPKSGVV